MIKYKVKVPHVFIEIFDIEASNEEEAKKLVLDGLSNRVAEAKPIYEQTLDTKNWPIITEEEYNKIVMIPENQQDNNCESEIAK